MDIIKLKKIKTGLETIKKRSITRFSKLEVQILIDIINELIEDENDANVEVL